MKWLLTILSLISALFSTVPPEDIPEQGISIVIEVSTNEEGEVKTEFEILAPETTDEWTIEEEEVNESAETTEVEEEVEITEATELTEATEATEAEEEVEITEETEPTEATEAEEEVETTEATEPTEATEAEEEVETTEVTEPTEATEAEEEVETTEATEPTEATEAEEEVETTEVTEPTEATVVEEVVETIEETESTEATEWNGEVLKCRKGVNYGPSGKETWYDLDMTGVINIMRKLGYSEEEYPYWVREDGCKMFGPYIMVAGDIRNTRTRGDIVETSLGTAMVCDHCAWAEWYEPNQLDIATDWVQTYSQRD